MRIDYIPRMLVALCIKEQHIMDFSATSRIVVRACALQMISLTNFLPEHAIQNNLQIVRGGRIAMQIEAAGRLEDR